METCPKSSLNKSLLSIAMATIHSTLVQRLYVFLETLKLKFPLNFGDDLYLEEWPALGVGGNFCSHS